MPTNRKRRTRHLVPQVPDAVYSYLETGKREPGNRDIFILQRSSDHLKSLWRALAKEILADWIPTHPCTRPWAWWSFDAPQEPIPGCPEFRAAQRKRLGGTGTPQHEIIAVVPGFDHGIPASWFDQEGAELFGGVAMDDADSPQFESEAEFLRRHNLLAPAEQKWLAGHPEAMVPDLLIFEGG